MRNVALGALVAAAAGLAWLPPLFTRGACTAEFDAVSDRLQQARAQILSLSAVESYLASHGLHYQRLTDQQCEASTLSDIVSCPGGALIIGTVLVKNRFCHYYRDGKALPAGIQPLRAAGEGADGHAPLSQAQVPVLDDEVDLGK